MARAPKQRVRLHRSRTLFRGATRTLILPELAPQREVAIHADTPHVAGSQLRCRNTSDICLKRDVARTVLREPQKRAVNFRAVTQDAQEHHLVAEAVTRSDVRTSKSSLAISTSAVKRSLVPAPRSSSACPLASTAMTGFKRALRRLEPLLTSCAKVNDGIAQTAPINIVARILFMNTFSKNSARMTTGQE